MGEEFSWLAGTLADLAREKGWPKETVAKMEELSQRLVYGVGRDGLSLSRIRLRGLGRTYIYQLVRRGCDTPEAVAEAPMEELEKVLPKRLAERLHTYCRAYHESKDEGAGAAPRPWRSNREVRPPQEAVSNDDLPSRLPSHLAIAERLSDDLSEVPRILIDRKQRLFFYRRYQVHLPPTTFNLMALLATKPGEVVTRDEIYTSLWPEFLNPDSPSNPYDRQISDHKRKITNQIRKALEGKTEIGPDEIKDLIRTRRKVGYVLNLRQADIRIVG